MNSQLLPFGPGAKIFIACYLLSLLVVGAVGFRARRNDSMKDFYLAGPGIGFIVLLLTLYSTQYSGNTMMGFTGKAYRVGFSWAACIHFMTAIVVIYLFFAPKLYRVAKENNFLTPADFVQHRFQMPTLTLVTSVVMTVAIANYLLAQLLAMGRVLEGLAPDDPDSKYQAFVAGIIVLAFIIVVYESLGGFRAVAWTDVIQGSVLILGFFILIGMVLRNYGSIENSTRILLQTQPEKLAVPSAAQCREWASYIILVGFGGALYPQALQRIYAARSATTLRRSLLVMAFLPLTTTLFAVVVGVVGAAQFSGLSKTESDTILFVICREIQQQSTFGYCLVVVLFSAVLAAIMSTADSVLLSISSMITNDIYGRHFNAAATQKQLTRFGKVCSWTLIVIVTVAAIQLRDTTLVNLLDRKFDLLVQLTPAFLIGIQWRKLSAKGTLYGIVIGVTLSLVLAFSGNPKPFGIHAGLYGLLANLIVAVSHSLRPSIR